MPSGMIYKLNLARAMICILFWPVILSVVGLQRPTAAVLLAPDSHIRCSGRDLAIPCERKQPNNAQ
jgi:hypothetical protein